MKFFKKILVHITDPTADKWMMGKAIEIAQRNNAPLTIIGVTEEVPQHLESLIHENFSLDLQRIIDDRKKSQLQKEIVTFEGKEVEIGYKTVHGRDFREIIKEVLRGSYSLLITRKIQENTLIEKFFGTATLNLIRECPCPVWIFPPRGEKRFAKILVSVDTNTTRDDEQELNGKLLRIAASIAKNEHGELHVLHCWEDEGKDLPEGKFAEIPDQQVKQYNVDAEKKEMEKFQEFLTPYRTTFRDDHIHFYKDDPGHGIPNITRNQGIKLLILGTLGRTGIERYVIGNTAERILNRVECSVLVIKPNGFISRVALDNDGQDDRNDLNKGQKSRSERS